MNQSLYFKEKHKGKIRTDICQCSQYLKVLKGFL